MANAKELLLELAKAVQAINMRLDAIEERLAALADDDLDYSVDFDIGSLRETQKDLNAAHTARVEAPAPVIDWDPVSLLREGEEPGEIDGAVILARRRISAGQGGNINVDVEASLSEEEWEGAQMPGGVMADFPKPSDEAKAAFAEAAQAVVENRPPAWGMDDATAIATYSKAGPLWLAAFDHDYLMGLPAGMLTEMVRQVALYSQREADNLFRDVGRADAEASKQHALDIIHDKRDARSES